MSQACSEMQCEIGSVLMRRHKPCAHHWQAMSNPVLLASQDNKNLKIPIREGSSSGLSSASDLKSKLLGERRESGTDRYCRSPQHVSHLYHQA